MKVATILLILSISVLLISCGGGGGGGKNADAVDNDEVANIDRIPGPIVFSPQRDVPVSSFITSNSVIISGINVDVNISVVNGEYSINNQMFIANQSTVSNNDQVKIRHNSSNSYNTQAITKLTIGDKTYEFSSTTESFKVQNIAPVANAGMDKDVITGNSVLLDGSSSSDGDGDSIVFNWSLVSVPSGSTATLNSSTTPTPSITPDVDGTYTISLVVNDGTADSVSDRVILVATSVPNTVPVANAGIDKDVITGDSVLLDGSGSTDGDGDSISFSWALVSAPSGSAATLNSSATSAPFITPDVDGTYTISLVVNDGTADSISDSVRIVATSASNNIPVADAGQDIIVYVGTTVFLNGSNSFDQDGDPITYEWVGISPPNSSAALFENNTKYPYFLPDVVGVYTLTLTVNDGVADSLVDSVTVMAVSLPVSSEIVVYSGDVFLGCWSCNEFNSDSIHNSFSQYGGDFGAYSIRNEFSLYGSSFGSASACNTLAISPPVIVDDKFYYGTMSINTFNSDGICNEFSSFYSNADCAILKNYCSGL